MSKEKKLVVVKGRPVEVNDKKITTGQFRLSYPHLFKPKKNPKRPEQQAKYSIAMLFDKAEDLSQLKIAAKNACIEKWGQDEKAWPSKKIRNKAGEIVRKSLVVLPFKDGDKEKPDKEEYENTIFFNANRNEEKGMPSVFDQGRNPITSSTGIKAGDYCRASMIANAYEVDGAFGVSFALLGVQLIKKGEALGGGGNAMNDFEDVEYEEGEEGSEGEEESEEDDTPEY